jgi:hypothetical protein
MAKPIIQSGRIRSSKAQVCRKCKQEIPEREESMKVEREDRNGRYRTKEVYYICIPCWDGKI